MLRYTNNTYASVNDLPMSNERRIKCLCVRCARQLTDANDAIRNKSAGWRFAGEIKLLAT